MHDVRQIAGYECRKAIAIINDTVSVVAFYTDEILLKGGPEGFTGLPGMILGLAIPRYNTTLFATKVEAKNVPILTIAPPAKGKRTDTEKDFKKMLDLYTRYDDKKNPRKIEDIKKELYTLIL
jgi:GLPGLI family protein